ncbi:uncharacterized protein BJX67DRAFT_377626 [Aspergillus lucknowensis]|uniref:Alpha-ketoglutarate-dependent dioxygenase AlkB-like domain-containing protein n=1 Tax=Aspergillus lucknowensis TaxID=176173 RepID=A0ABR4M349_9EURO
MHPLSIRAVIDDFELAPIKRAIVFDPSDKEKGQLITPQIEDRSFSPYRKFTYTLPGAGTVTQFVSNRQINSRPDGPDDIFQQLQEVDLGLRRYPLSAAKVGGTLNAQFAVNYGMPYDFVVDVDSRAFSEACDPILRVLGRLTWATDKAVEAEGEGGTAQKPNELLALGYFEDMNINYHDDGESTLGPTIASLSLGSKAVKTLRMKYKYYYGLTKNTKNVLDPKADPVLEGCAGREWRLKLKQELTNGSIAEKDYKEEWKKRQKEWAGGRRLGDPPVCIITELHHGDMVVMNGEGVQKYYEHAVALEKGGGSKLRFALTARHVIKEKLGNKSMGQAWKGDFKLTPGQTYDGK